MPLHAFDPRWILAAIVTLASPVLVSVVFAIGGEGSKAHVLGKPLAWRDTIKMGLQLGFLLDVVIVLIIAVTAGAGPTTRWLARTSSGNHVVLTGCAILAGTVLFALRKRHRMFYGMIEVAACIGGMIVYPVAPAPASEGLSTQTVAWALGLLSLIYILVRGLDNIDVGRAARRANDKALTGQQTVPF
jgi:hypothetical protein